MIYLFPVIATHRDGNTVLLYSVREVVDFVKGKLVGRYWHRDTLDWWNPRYMDDHNDWILRDDRGRHVDHREFIPARRNWKNRKGKHEFRNGPVPFGYRFRGCVKFKALRKRHGGIRAHRVLPDIIDKEFKGRKLTVRYFD